MSGLTRRHYVALAAALNAVHRTVATFPDARRGASLAAIAVARVLCEDNPHIDRVRFLRDCGVAEEYIAQ